MTPASVGDAPRGQRVRRAGRGELAERGHRVVIAAPSELAGRGPRVAAGDRRGGRRPASLFDGAGNGADGRGVPVLALGSGHPAAARPAPAGRAGAARRQPRARGPARRRRARRRPRPRPVRAQRLARRPCATRARSTSAASTSRPSACSRPRSRGRWSRSSSGRLDARTTSCATTAELMERFFPGPYELVEPGRRPRRRAAGGRARRAGRRRAPDADRLLRSTRSAAPCACSCARSGGCSPPDDWEVGRLGAGRRARCGSPQQLRDRGSASSGPGDSSPEELIAGADVARRRVRRPARRARPGPQGARRRAPSRSCSQLAALQRAHPRRRARAAVPARRRDHPRGPARAAAREPGAAPRARRGRRAGRSRDWGAVDRPGRGDLRSGSARAATTRAGNPEIRRRIARRREIHVDLHMHTDHSPDCATPVETLLATAREVGLGRDRDHRPQRDLGRAGRARDRRRVRGQGDRRRGGEDGRAGGGDRPLPRGADRARDDDGRDDRRDPRQGGLVYVPHPFDRLHSVPDYEHLLDMVEEIDILEVFNPRVALTRVQRGGRALRGQVPDRPRRRLRQPRRPGPRQRDDPRPRLRRPGGVPRVDARRRHRPQASEPVYVQALKCCRPAAGAAARRSRARAAGKALMQPPQPAGGRRGAVKESRRLGKRAARTRPCRPPTTRSRRSTSSARSASSTSSRTASRTARTARAAT